MVTTINYAALVSNPVGDYLNLSVDGTFNNDVKVEIFNAAGIVEYSGIFKTASSSIFQTLNLSDLIQGSYILKVTYDKEEISRKIIKQ